MLIGEGKKYLRNQVVKMNLMSIALIFLFCTEIGLTQTTMTSSIHEEEAGEGAIGTEKKK